MLPALEPYTLVLFVRGERGGDPADDQQLDQLQDAHVSYLMGLIDEGRIVVCGPVADPARNLRGMAVFRTSVDEATELMRRDPAVASGRIAVQVMTWWAEKGRLPDILRGL